jgi:hypothetical protein
LARRPWHSHDAPTLLTARATQDNIGAWFYFFAFNVLVSWYLAVLLDLLPLAIVALVRAVWGSVTEKMKVHVETYGVVKGWIKPIFYAASIWGSWAVLFQQIYNLHSTTDGVPSRAPYTRRVRPSLLLMLRL